MAVMSCECGRYVSVREHMAGGQVGCECGRSLAVPALHHLRELPDYAPPLVPESAGVARICPACSGETYTTVRSSQWVAFAGDRVCAGCGTRYTPPTPVWGAVLLVLAGLPLAAFGLLAVLLWLNDGNPMRIPAVACEAFVGFLGVLAVGQGVRALLRPGQV
jgi:hypothetical protein